MLSCGGAGRNPRRGGGGPATRWVPASRPQRPVPGRRAAPACGGRLISSVVNFGDPLPHKELALAEQHARRCDLMLALGSSLMVTPASSLVGLALRCGARVVLANRGKTPYDAAVTLRAWTGIGDVIPPAVGRAKRALGEQPSMSWARNEGPPGSPP